MKYKLKVYSIWEPGQRVNSEGKSQQEDSIFPAYNQQKDSDRLFILCDGMGGHESGEVASSTVCTAMSNSVLNSVPDGEGDFDDNNLRQAIEDAFNALDDLLPDDVHVEKKMGTTMTFLKFHSKGCTIAHMGDSRVYHIRPGKGRDDSNILFKTNDHSLINDLIKIGELTPEEAKQSKQKNIITRAMQPKMERRPKPDIYHTVDIKEGDYFYMCSDGMLEQMEDENLLFNFSEATGDDENKVKILTQATSQNLDNHSAIIVHILEVIDPLPVEAAPIQPAANKPEPIMAEVEDDSPADDNDSDEQKEEKNIVTDDTAVEQPPVTEATQSDKDSISDFDKSNGSNETKKPLAKVMKIIKYLIITLTIILLALGIFLIGTIFSSKSDVKHEKTEIPHKAIKKTEGKRRGRTTKQDISALPTSENPNETTAQDNSMADLQSDGHNASTHSSAQDMLHNSLSSHSTQQVKNVASSDQQAVMDLSNSKNHKKGIR